MVVGFVLAGLFVGAIAAVISLLLGGSPLWAIAICSLSGSTTVVALAPSCVFWLRINIRPSSLNRNSSLRDMLGPGVRARLMPDAERVCAGEARSWSGASIQNAVRRARSDALGSALSQ